jgi:hypothetical protein
MATGHEDAAVFSLGRKTSSGLTRLGVQLWGRHVLTMSAPS